MLRIEPRSYDMVTCTKSEDETIREGERLGRTLRSGDIVAISGGLGAGKTAFAKGLAAGLGVTSPVTSPTFTIVNEHTGEIPLYHFDMFRLENESDLYDIGWDDYIAGEGVCVVEWSEKIKNALPPGVVSVVIENLGGDLRRLEICR
jgi:tRNA threonylcarbamoyladenosine biosynthesis protein TsaE